MVECPPRGGDHNVDTASQRLQLPPDWLSSIDRQHTNTHVSAVFMDRLRHLHRELARRYEHQRLDIATLAVTMNALQ